MGCITSRLLSADGATGSSLSMDDHDLPNHIVSLISTTYGVLNFDRFENHGSGLCTHESSTNGSCRSHSSNINPKLKKKSFTSASPEINWSSVDDTPRSSPKKIHGKENITLNRVLRPLRFIENKQHKAPGSSAESKKSRLFGSELVATFEQKSHEETREIIEAADKDLWEDFIDHTPTSLFKPQRNIFEKKNRTSNRLFKPLHFSECKLHKTLQSSAESMKSPLFDPELVASFAQKLHVETEQIKRMPSPENFIENLKEKVATASLITTFGERNPPGEDNAVVLYTTSLQGIRKTFEDCNLVRSVIELYNVCVIEKDVFMDMGFREELRKLVGAEEAKPPVLLLKGEVVRGAAEVLKLEDAGVLKLMLEGVPPAAMNSCLNCGGLRFFVCQECNGSCKVLDDSKEKKINCNTCNENGLIFCPSCSRRRT